MTSANVHSCTFGGPLNVNVDQSTVVNSVFLNSLTLNNPTSKHYNEKECFRQSDHKMFKAMCVACPCAGPIPMQIKGRNGGEVRLYEDDIVFMDHKGQLMNSLADTLAVVQEQQKTIKQLKRQVERLEKKSRKK